MQMKSSVTLIIIFSKKIYQLRALLKFGKLSPSEILQLPETIVSEDIRTNMLLYAQEKTEENKSRLPKWVNM
jgi:hypothetical protein